MPEEYPEAPCAPQPSCSSPPPSSQPHDPPRGDRPVHEGRPARFGTGILQLYYNICRGILDFGKTVVVTSPDLPKAVATDVFQVGQKRIPEAYYMTEREKQERERQDELERRLKKQRKKEPGIGGLTGSGAAEDRPSAGR